MIERRFLSPLTNESDMVLKNESLLSLIKYIERLNIVRNQHLGMPCHTTAQQIHLQAFLFLLH